MAKMEKLPTEGMGFDQGKEMSEGVAIRAVSRFRRHANPEKDPETGRSLDFINEAGVEQAVLIGCESQKMGRWQKLKKAFHSPKQRAWETLRYMLSESGKEDIKVFEKPELEAMNFTPNVSANMGWKDKEKGVKRNLDETIDFLLAHPEEQEEVQNIAERIAHRVNIAGNMPKYLKAGDDVETESVTHGPVQEAFLKKVLIQKDGKRGFDSVSEFGGAFKPGEGFEIETLQKSDGTTEKKLVIYRLDEKGVKEISRTEHDIDWEEVKRLGEAYRQKRVAEQKGEMGKMVDFAMATYADMIGEGAVKDVRHYNMGEAELPKHIDEAWEKVKEEMLKHSPDLKGLAAMEKGFKKEIREEWVKIWGI